MEQPPFSLGAGLGGIPPSSQTIDQHALSYRRKQRRGRRTHTKLAQLRVQVQRLQERARVRCGSALRVTARDLKRTRHGCRGTALVTRGRLDAGAADGGCAWRAASSKVLYEGRKSILGCGEVA